MINPVGFYSNLDYGSVYSDYKSVANSYITAPQPFVMDTRRCTPQLSDYIIYPDEKTKEIVENAREMFAEYKKEEKYKIQPKDLLYKSTPITEPVGKTFISFDESFLKASLSNCSFLKPGPSKL